jgi:thiamine-monophosphate kinase
MNEPRTLSGFGEDRLVRRLLAELGPDVLMDRSLVADATEGDDCAVVRAALRGGKYLLLKSDCVIEGRHFQPDTPAAQVGWKALARPLSDIAACAGRPLHALITIALPGDTTTARARGIYRGLGRCAAEFGVLIVGGETARTDGPVMIAVSLTGEVAPKRCCLRSAGKAGDALFVTGRLGGSLATGHHLNFRPRLSEARWLAKNFKIRAMMDLSDGLGADLPRLALASGVGFQIDPEALPRADGVTPEQAMHDGEDYELLFSLPAADALELSAQWAEKFPDVALTRIGELTAPGTRTELPRGYDHFA